MLKHQKTPSCLRFQQHGLVRLILYSKFAENPSKNKMDAIARALESCSLRLMGSWLKKSGIRVANDWDPDYMK